MAVATFARHKVWVREPGKRIVNGAERDDWSKPGPEREYKRCWVVPGVTEEDLVNRDASSIAYTAQLPEHAVVFDYSKIRLEDGLDYAVVGQPVNVPSPTGRLAHVKVLLKRWVG